MLKKGRRSNLYVWLVIQATLARAHSGGALVVLFARVEGRERWRDKFQGEKGRGHCDLKYYHFFALTMVLLRPDMWQCWPLGFWLTNWFSQKPSGQHSRHAPHAFIPLICSFSNHVVHMRVNL